MNPPLPTALSFGQVAVYGAGVQTASPNTTTPNGLILEPNYRFGTVYHVWAGGTPYIYGGDVVYWKEGDQIGRVVTNQNITFTIVPARLVTRDNLYIAP